MLANHGRWGVIQADCLDVLHELPTSIFSLVLTDPAWEFIDQHRAWGTTTRLKNWFQSFPNERLPSLFQQLHRVLWDDGICYMFADRESAQLSVPLALAAGFNWHNTLTWFKTDRQGKVRIGNGYHWRKCTEVVLFFGKGNRRLKDLGRPEALFGPSGPGPAEKPINILYNLITNSCEPGAPVLDCFAGSGSTGAAAILADRIPVLIDLKTDGIEDRLLATHHAKGLCMPSTACPHCGFQLALSAEVERHRRVIFEVCPACSKKLNPSIEVLALGVEQSQAQNTPPVIVHRLED